MPIVDTPALSCYNYGGWKECLSGLDDSLPRNQIAIAAISSRR